MIIKYRECKVEIKELSIYISTMLFLISTVIFPRVFDMVGEYGKYINILKIIAAFYNLGLFLILFKANKKTLVGMYFVFLLSLSILNMSFINFVIYILVLYAYGDSEKNFKVYVYTKLTLVIIIFILGLFGLNSIYDIYEVERGVRHTLGFTNPNTSSMMIFDVILGLIYIHKNNKRVIFSTIVLAIGVFYYTNTRTLLMVYIVFLILLTIKPKTFKAFRFIMTRAFVICFLLSIGNSLFHNTPLNMILNRRPEMTYEFLRFYKLNLFGYSRQGLTVSVDNSYLRILIELGVIYFIVHSILMKNVLIKLFKHKDYIGVKVILVIFIYDIFEQFSIAHGSILLVFIASYMINRGYNGGARKSFLQRKQNEDLI